MTPIIMSRDEACETMAAWWEAAGNDDGPKMQMTRTNEEPAPAQILIERLLETAPKITLPANFRQTLAEALKQERGTCAISIDYNVADILIHACGGTIPKFGVFPIKSHTIMQKINDDEYCVIAKRGYGADEIYLDKIK